MKKSLPSLRCLEWSGERLRVLDQRRLPHAVEYLECTDSKGVVDAIACMAVRGAPAIGIAAAYGLALAARRGEDVDQAARALLASRPTAVNLRWALDRMRAVPPSEWSDEAARIHAEDQAINEALSGHGADFVESLHPTGRIELLTHCNTGALATGGWGTALGIVRSLHARGRDVHVWVDETRPWLQGARLTTWELLQEQIPCTLLADAAAPVLMASGRVQAAVVGCDRVARNGDFANKTGTYAVALACAAHQVPFIVGMPWSSLDLGCPNGAAIPIEQRAASEVLGWGGQRWAPEVAVFNPAFDVTPARLVTAFASERGVVRPPFAVDGSS